MERRVLLGMVPAVLASSASGFAQGRGRAQGPGLTAEQRAPVTSTPPGARDRFVGVYRLVVYQPHGDRPTGRIYYDAAGHMGALLHQPDRTPLPETPTIDDYRAATQGLVAYYGTYDVDPATGRVVHHIEAASNPAWIGTDFFRWYAFEGNRLTLRTNPSSSNPLVWERLPDK